jgi:hypothetical protein
MSFLFTIPVLIVQTVHGIVHGILCVLCTCTHCNVLYLSSSDLSGGLCMIWYILSMSDYITLWYYVIYFELLYLVVSELCCFEGHSEICISVQI